MTLATPLASRYFARLHLDPTQLDSEPTAQKLKEIHEAHVTHIPFENLAQHGAVGGPPTLDMEATAIKVLDRKRGGFCMELNGLLSCLLRELGYQVQLVPSYVFQADGYTDEPAHLILIVTCAGPEDDVYYVDVGFGEPSLYPLDYTAFDTVQMTPEGMKSQLIQHGDEVELQWFKNDMWMPRLKWSYSDSMTPNAYKLSDFQKFLEYVQQPESIFAQKTITAILNRTHKVSLAGNKLTITSPRFPSEDNGTPNIQVRYLESELEAREVLLEHCGIPMEESEGLDWNMSLKADPLIWSFI
jgi:N-hydroxyarylamine O-acetyltransferase